MSQFSNFQPVVNSSLSLAHNVSICVRAGLPKPRPVPDTERNKDTKTLDYASTPLDANTLLAVVAYTAISSIETVSNCPSSGTLPALKSCFEYAFKVLTGFKNSPLGTRSITCPPLPFIN